MNNLCKEIALKYNGFENRLKYRIRFYDHEYDLSKNECPVLGTFNLMKALKERNEAIRREYEAFNRMHNADGTFVKSSRFSEL